LGSDLRDGTGGEAAMIKVIVRIREMLVAVTSINQRAG
jgi:hypothetical protein